MFLLFFLHEQSYRKEHLWPKYDIFKWYLVLCYDKILQEKWKHSDEEKIKKIRWYFCLKSD